MQYSNNAGVVILCKNILCLICIMSSIIDHRHCRKLNCYLHRNSTIFTILCFFILLFYILQKSRHQYKGRRDVLFFDSFSLFQITQFVTIKFWKHESILRPIMLPLTVKHWRPMTVGKHMKGNKNCSQ